MTGSARRPRGRPRDRAIHRRILEATLSVVAERGINGAAVDEIAIRSGVSKATIYGRWPSKEALCVEAMRHTQPELALARTPDPRGDCIAMLTDLSGTPASADHRLLPRLIAEISASPELARIFREKIAAPPRDACAEIIGRAIAARQLAAATNISLAVDLLVGPIFYRRIIASAVPMEPGLPQSLVDAVWKAFAAS
jgi:AcrR family transcriptional regulator